jgi:hypothetical protein
MALTPSKTVGAEGISPKPESMNQPDDCSKCILIRVPYLIVLFAFTAGNSRQAYVRHRHLKREVQLSHSAAFGQPSRVAWA